MRRANRRVTFTVAERARLADACRILGITFEEFVHFAAMHALDEFESVDRAVSLWRRRGG